jgi:2-oxoacid:acceptor oxidoreductase delta subunit (pyruvate/2-ketoisovalerate family)
MKARGEVCRVIGAGEAKIDRTLTAQEAAAEAARCTASSPCSYCDVCQLLCPDLAITRDAGTGRIAIDLAFCKGCGLCAAFCPRGAIRMVVDE